MREGERERISWIKEDIVERERETLRYTPVKLDRNVRLCDPFFCLSLGIDWGPTYANIPEYSWIDVLCFPVKYQKHLQGTLVL